jgi:hypothetical protein
VNLAVAANPGSATLSCTGGLSKASVNGVATFSGCRLDKVGVGYTLTAAATGLTSATSAPFDVADRLVFVTQPSGASAGFAFGTQPQVAVRAGPTNTATHDQATQVTLAIQPGTGAAGATLSCTGGNTKTVVNGAASFAGCKIDKASPANSPYQLVATATNLTSATSNSFTVAAGTEITLTPSAGVITWGGTVTLNVQFGLNGANRAFQLQGARDGVSWATITSSTTTASGFASYAYRPATNLYYRVVFAGAPDLGAANSNTARVVVRQIAIFRPTNSGTVKPIARGTSITFVTTVRPARAELPPARVSFVFYRKLSGVWVLVAKRDVIANAVGQAVTTWTFSPAGEWYVRSIANPTPYNANSVWSAVERYNVR